VGQLIWYPEMSDSSNKLQGHTQRFAIELIVIIAGVLIALAIDEWRQNLRDADLEQEYLSQLVSDLQETANAMTEVEQINADAMDAIHALIAMFEEGPTDNLARIRELLWRILIFDNPVPILGTVDALIATGDLRLIRNPRIRTSLTKYNSIARDFRLAAIYQWEDAHSQLSSRLFSVALGHGIAPQGRAGVFGNDEISDIAGFLQNTEAYGIAIEKLYLKQVFANYRVAVAEDALELKRLIEAGGQLND